MIAIIVTAIICSTSAVLGIYWMYKFWENQNPYTDEIHEEGVIKDEDGMIIGRCYTFKRIYKNGTVNYIRKTMKN